MSGKLVDNFDAAPFHFALPGEAVLAEVVFVPRESGWLPQVAGGCGMEVTVAEERAWGEAIADGSTALPLAVWAERQRGSAITAATAIAAAATAADPTAAPSAEEEEEELQQQQWSVETI